MLKALISSKDIARQNCQLGKESLKSLKNGNMAVSYF